MILHISDTHFGTERPEAVRALIELAARRRPQLLVLSGDITQRARASQFASARRFVQDLCAASGIDAARDVLAIPGNHDIPLFNLAARLVDPYAGYRHAFGPVLEPVLERGCWHIVGVNTTRPWRHKHGELSTAQIERVAARLCAARPDALRIVVTHQPVYVAEADDRKDLTRGHQAAIRAWSSAGADLVLSGHIHQSFVRPLPVPCAQTWAVQTGTAVSNRTRDHVPNSVHLVRLGDGASAACAVVERWDWTGPEGFRQVAETPVRTARGGASG